MLTVVRIRLINFVTDCSYEMKVLKILISACIFFSLAQIISCHEEVKIKNQLIVGDRIYPLAKAFIFKAGGPVYNDVNEYLGQIYTLYFTSEHVTYLNNHAFSFSGKDEFLTISFLSSTENELASGKFIVKETDYVPNCITTAHMQLEWNFNPGPNQGMSWIVTGGEAHIKKNSSGYDITFSFDLKNGPDFEKCRGSFTGPYYTYP